MNEEERVEQKDNKDKLHVQAMLYFLLGILLSTCITAVSISYALPKLVVKTEDAAVSAVTSELVKDTINASFGNYLATNKIAISDDSMEEIVQYIIDSVNSQSELTENELSEVENLIKVSIQGANENMNINAQTTNDNLNNSMMTLQEFVVNGDNEVSGALKDYIDKYVVPGINNSLEMNTEDIVSVNQTIVEMGNEYDSYREINDTNLVKIIGMIETYRKETREELNECQTELTEKLNDFCMEYDSYVEKTDSKIDNIETALGDYVTVSDFKEFKSSYETYRENMKDTVMEIKETLNELETGKADKEAVETLAGNFGDLKIAYETFTGKNGSFEYLKNRVTDTETALNQNSSSIVALEEKIGQLENSLEKSHPVGSVYISFGNENPADMYGGTWEKVEDTFLMCSGSTYPVGTEGGENSIILGAENIPSLNMTGNTTAKNGVGTSAGGAYSETITSQGNYTGGTYTTSTNGNHSHGFGAILMAYFPGGTYQGFMPNGEYMNLWSASNYTSIGNTDDAGNHNHTVSIPSQTITSTGSLSIGNHSHTVNIPTLNVNGSYTNTNLQSVDVTNKYVAVNVWKRIA